MYISSRTLEANPGQIEDTLALASWVTGTINERIGADFGVSVEVGGNPNAVHATAVWESLGAYEAARAAIAADQEIANAMRMASNVSTTVGDSLGQVLAPPGDRSAFAGINFARVQISKIADAIPFCLEIASAATEITGNQVGLVRAYTGDADRILWVSFHDSLQSMQESQSKLDSNEDFMAYYKRSADVMVENSLEQTIRAYV